MPRYTPRKPPAATNPCGDCRRVLSVSMGKRARSTVVPAMPPAIREVRKGVWRSLSGAMVVGDSGMGG